MTKNDKIPKAPVKKASPAPSTSQLPFRSRPSGGSSSGGNPSGGNPSAGNLSGPSTAGTAPGPSSSGGTPRPPPTGNTSRPPSTREPSRPPSAGDDGSNPQFDLKRFSLNYYDEAGDCKPYPPNSREFVLVADTYRIGLALLSRPDVEPYLLELGHRCVQEWNDPANAKKYKNYQWPGNISSMNIYVRRFLTGVRNSPPRIIVDSAVEGFAYTVKDVNSSYTGSLENFRPQDLVHFEINRKLVQSLKRNDDKFMAPWDPRTTKPADYDKKVKQQNDRWQTLRFIVSITWFHEFCHAFVTFLAGNRYADTPPAVTNPAFTSPDDAAGESGFWTETRVFGGCALMTPSLPSGDPEEDLKVYMVNDDDQCRDVSTKTMKDLMLQPKTYDLKNGIKTIKPWPRMKKASAQSKHTEPATPKSRAGIAAAKRYRCWDVRFVRATNMRMRVDAVESSA